MKLFVKVARSPFVKRERRSSSKEEAVCPEREEAIHQCGAKERTMNFHVGKFKIQHDHMMSEFQLTSMCTAHVLTT